MSAISNLRFKDVIFALAAASKSNTGLGRLQLQKFIYLTEVFSTVWREVSKPAGFRPYPHGPYDRQIQKAVDALVFRGILQVRGLSFRTINVRATYYLAEEGSALVNQLSEDPVLREEIELCEEIAAEVARRGWEKIRDIVYSEPTYCAARSSNDGSRLRTNRPIKNQTSRLVRLFQASWLHSAKYPLTPSMFVQVMFLVFDEYHRNQSEKNEASE